jgi:hypothetical protein
MTLRRTLVLLGAVLALTAAACGDDDGDATTTTEAETSTSVTTTTLSDADFESAMADAEAQLEAAGDDLCKIAEAETTQAAPANPEQMERWIKVQTRALTVIADTLAEEDPTSAEALRTAADELLAEAEKADFDPEFLTGESPPAALTSPAYTEAAQALQGKYTADCAQQMVPGAEGGEDGATTTTAAPEG